MFTDNFAPMFDDNAMFMRDDSFAATAPAPSPAPLWYPLPPRFAQASVVTNDSKHNAFPSACVAANDDLVIAYRKAASHVSSDGEIAVRRYTPSTQTWSTENIAFTSATYEYRFAGLTTLTNGRITMAIGRRLRTGAEIVSGVQFAYSDDNGISWSTPVNVTHNLTQYAREGGRVLEMPNGDLLYPLHGQNTGDSSVIGRCRVSKSTDGGATWSHLGDISGSGQYYEPGLVRTDDGALLCLIRWASSAIYSSISVDDGATWSLPYPIIQGFEGLQAPYRLQDGSIAVYVRQQGYALGNLLWSADGGAWAITQAFPASPAGVQVAYGAVTQAASGVVYCVYATESPNWPNPGNSDVMMAIAIN